MVVQTRARAAGHVENIARQRLVAYSDSDSDADADVAEETTTRDEATDASASAAGLPPDFLDPTSLARRSPSRRARPDAERA